MFITFNGIEHKNGVTLITFMKLTTAHDLDL